jgi:hypothetical protein
MALKVRGHVIPLSHCSVKRSNSGCDVGGLDGVHGIRLSGLPKRTGHDSTPLLVPESYDGHGAEAHVIAS